MSFWIFNIALSDVQDWPNTTKFQNKKKKHEKYEETWETLYLTYRIFVVFLLRCACVVSVSEITLVLLKKTWEQLGSPENKSSLCFHSSSEQLKNSVVYPLYNDGHHQVCDYMLILLCLWIC